MATAALQVKNMAFGTMVDELHTYIELVQNTTPKWGRV